MEVQLSPGQSNAIDRIAEEEGFEDFDVTTNAGSLKGDNYMGVITKVGVKNHRKKLDLILKSASSNVKLREIVPIRKAFVREITIYETVFPAFDEFLKENGCPEGFSGHPKVYGTCNEENEEFLLLENLKEIGYDLWERTTPMDWDHVALVLKEYGKFHAISLAMKEKNPEIYDKLTKDLTNVFARDGQDQDEMKEIIEREARKALSNGIKAVKGNRKAEEAMEKFSDTIFQFFQELQMPENHLVLLHGDCWCNNLLFKYEDPKTKRPSKVCLIDWQLSVKGSPAVDLSYFLFTCAPKEILADHQKYLKIYHDAASETLRNVGCDPNTVFPFALLEKHWRKYAKFGVYLAVMVLKLMLSEKSEVPDLTEAADAGKSFLEGISYDSVNNDDYNRRLLDVVVVCVENDWL
ncbi:hypothetical protein NQ318_013353 [Aromia moschata]|uniref:CHK kinase-like domain-containing protein n=1 Tax=Aromia moschata TaxID=1265417 RepID=A0AAV8XUC8_9CUCU|nr:hypothetical protein NQ318_013353 [Aromia moschata]